MKSSLTLLPFILSLGGCAVGYNAALFVTKSNLGLDVDTKPPTAEISIARREGVIAPGFEGGQTPPVISSFRNNSNPFSRFFFGVQSTFAGGDAAVGLAQGPGGRTTGHESGLCLSQQPGQQQFLWWDVSIPGKGEVRPFFFATDTTFGLKVAWSGTTGQFPDTVRLGFNRKEFAWAPLFGTNAARCKIPGTAQDGSYVVWMPSFLAVLDNNVQVGQPSETGVKWLQYFATGTSATTLANDDEVRQVMQKRTLPVVYQGQYDDGPDVRCLQQWLSAGGDATQRQAHAQQLQSWWRDEKKLGGYGTILIKTKEFKEQRAEFIRTKGIPCNG